MGSPNTCQRAEVFRKGILALKEAGVPSPALDASILLGHATGESPEAVLLDRNRLLTAGERDCFETLIKRRCGRETVSRLVGTKEFFSLKFRTGHDVLDPRPETELLVETALAFLRSLNGRPRVLEIGTGSGAIAATLALLDPRVSIVATDICPRALGLAAINAREHGVSRRIRFLRTDMVSAFSPRARFDLLVSNPPYIALGEFPFLPEEVRLGDPYSALVAGPEGTEFFGPLADAASCLLRTDGAVMVEVGAGQGPLVERVFLDRGIRDVTTEGDLAGIGRVVRGIR